MIYGLQTNFHQKNMSKIEQRLSISRRFIGLPTHDNLLNIWFCIAGKIDSSGIRICKKRLFLDLISDLFDRCWENSHYNRNGALQK